MKANLIKTGQVIDGKEVFAVELTNTHGTYVKIYNYGAIVSNFIVTNARGEQQDIVLGFDDFESYLSEDYLKIYPYLGAIVGRYENRIKGGKFTIEGQDIQLEQNNGEDTLHGGLIGFDRKVWDILPTIDPSLTLQYISPDGEEHFPGNLTVQVTYKLSDNNELIVDFKASTDKTTAVNLTHHGYFNLSPNAEPINNHHHRMPASKYLKQDSKYVVTGELVPVEGTQYDFLGSKLISADWDPTEGYDQSFVLDKQPGEITMASETSEDNSGLKLSIYTTAPVAHFYTAKFLDVKNGKAGKSYGPYGAFCVETQFAPNSVNIPSLPSTLLHPGEIYKQTTIYKIEHK
jgi:aldose 1-epimerase